MYKKKFTYFKIYDVRSDAKNRQLYNFHKYLRYPDTKFKVHEHIFKYKYIYIKLFFEVLSFLNFLKFAMFTQDIIHRNCSNDK